MAGYFLLATDVGRWVRDYGAFVVSAAAAGLAAVSAKYAQQAARQSQHEGWVREMRLPIYLAFARSVDDVQRTGVEAISDMLRALAEVELAGPPVVVQRARELAQQAALYYSGKTVIEQRNEARS